MIIKNMKCTFLGLILILLLGGCSTTTAIPYATTKDLQDSIVVEQPVAMGDILAIGFLSANHVIKGPYVISPDDIIKVDVIDHPKLSKDSVSVLSDGHVSLPLIGRVNVAGMGVELLGETLKDQYIENNIADPIVVVSVEQSQNPLAPLLRLVNRAGQYEPLQVVIGQSPYIDLPFIEAVSSTQTLSKMRAEIKQKYRALFGERLFVMVQLQKAAPPVIYVIGEVTRPGPVAFTRPSSPLMAVAAAGGFVPTAESKDVRLFRRKEDNTYENWAIDLAGRLDSGKSLSDQFELLPSDVIYVPKSGIAEANEVVEQYIRNMLPVQFGIGFSYSINSENN